MKLVVKGTKKKDDIAEVYLRQDGDGDVSVGIEINGFETDVAFFTKEEDKLSLMLYSLGQDPADEYLNIKGGHIKTE